MEIGRVKQFNKDKGNRGEGIAVAWLEKQGFSIIERNYTVKHGEIDIIAKRDARIHFIEVKLRSSSGFGGGRAAVNATKRKTIRNVATIYLIKKGLWDKVGGCFDVIEITEELGKFRIEFLENCF